MNKVVKKSLYHSDKDAPSKQEDVPPKNPVISTQAIFSVKSGQRHISFPAYNTRILLVRTLGDLCLLHPNHQTLLVILLYVFYTTNQTPQKLCHSCKHA